MSNVHNAKILRPLTSLRWASNISLLSPVAAIYLCTLEEPPSKKSKKDQGEPGTRLPSPLRRKEGKGQRAEGRGQGDWNEAEDARGIRMR